MCITKEGKSFCLIYLKDMAIKQGEKEKERRKHSLRLKYKLLTINTLNLEIRGRF